MTTDSISTTLKALADPKRRKIVEILRESSELRVSDLAKAFEMTLAGVSKHIRVLESAGLIKREVRWKEHWLAVDLTRMKEAYEWFSFHHNFWNKRLDNLNNLIGKDT